jgi:hypothetical protein
MDSQGLSQMSSLASMHLARTVRTVIGCKENIWEAYKELFWEQLSDALVVRSPKHKKNLDGSAGRDEFEIAWSNWER